MEPECSMHQALTNAVTNIEVQYVDIKKDLADIKASMTEIKTKLAIIDSHDIINKVASMESTLSTQVATSSNTQNWFKITMALIIILGGLVGVKLAF